MQEGLFFGPCDRVALLYASGMSQYKIHAIGRVLGLECQLLSDAGEATVVLIKQVPQIQSHSSWKVRFIPIAYVSP